MSELRTIAADTVVDLTYTLFAPTGEVIDGTDAGETFAYLHGHSNIVSGLEARLAGRRVGERLEVKVPAEEAYGVRRTEGPKRVPREAFPEGAQLEEGEQYLMQQDDEEPVPFWVLDVSEDGVVIDFDHPLAGLDLRFEVEIHGVRAASADELAHGHAHSPGGAHHH